MPLPNIIWSLAFATCLAGGASAQEAGADAVDLVELDDECRAEDEQSRCSLSALQRRGLKLTKAGVSSSWHLPTWMPERWDPTRRRSAVYDPAFPEELATPDEPPPPEAPDPEPVQPPSPGTVPPVIRNRECGGVEVPENANCRDKVVWVAKEGKWDPQAPSWFSDLRLVAGVNLTDASQDDFQRLYFCSPPGGIACKLPPCGCSRPPCNTCFAGASPRPKRAGCTEHSTSIDCKPPAKPLDYKGMAWPTMTFKGNQEMHIFAIGDWGGMDGTLNPIEDRSPLVVYSWGNQKGPSAFPRTRWNKYHTVELCNHTEFIDCYNSRGAQCRETCGFVVGVDDQPQIMVASAMRARAALAEPQYILNVGDNFYWGGIEKTCGTPMDQLSFIAYHQFDQVFEGVYNGQGLADKPWLSVLGNHDWGGRQFNNGWDQQIAYTWVSNRWIMPAPYYMVHVDYPDKGFSVDIYMIDSNIHDAKHPLLDPEHNLCGSAHNPIGADCSSANGPASVETCPGFFAELWWEQQMWLEEKLSGSRATWQIMVTHFPCGEDGAGQQWYRMLRMKFGLDLLVTGHRHDQELWLPTDGRNYMGGLTCIVTGGGGGISSEATPNPNNTQDWYGEGQYGFYDISISATNMVIMSINWDGKVLASTSLTPR